MTNAMNSQADESDDEAKRAAVHDVVGASGDLRSLVEPWGKAKAQQILDRVLADYVVELNRALGASDRQVFGIDPTAFMRQYGEIWKVKLQL